MTNPDTPAWTPERVKGLRKRLGLTQEQFAVQLGVAAASVHRWEAGKKTPGRLAIHVLEEAEREAR